jgi:hypothetical protein
MPVASYGIHGPTMLNLRQRLCQDIYGGEGGYSFFSGIDGTKAFITGNKKERERVRRDEPKILEIWRFEMNRMSKWIYI